MNREIKFRGWHKTAKEMFIEDGIKYRFGECLKFLWEKQPVEVMQYTGLKDKNGKEIYEGDIVSFRHRRSEKLTNLFPPEEIKDITNIPIQVWMSVVCQGNSKEPDGDIEVIGNIYENPELMEV